MIQVHANDITEHRSEPRAARAAVLDFQRFAGALELLEEYVDGLLEAAELPAMDSWVEDEVMDARLASL